MQDCTELVAPSMWKNHLNLHTQGVLPGSVPDDWLHENNMVTCSHCHHLVASTHIMSHQRKCATPRSNTNTQMDVPLFNDRTAQLPSFEKCATYIVVLFTIFQPKQDQHLQKSYRQLCKIFCTLTMKNLG